MTPEDLELAVRLARFMGWPEERTPEAVVLPFAAPGYGNTRGRITVAPPLPHCKLRRVRASNFPNGSTTPEAEEADIAWFLGEGSSGGVWLNTSSPTEPVKRWSPLSIPSQAAMVMAEAIRSRGWRLEMHVGLDGWCRVWDRWGTKCLADSPRFEGDPVAGWCRSVCLSILEAAEAERGEKP